jgi:hypothetical protein
MLAELIEELAQLPAALGCTSDSFPPRLFQAAFGASSANFSNRARVFSAGNSFTKGSTKAMLGSS